MLIVVARRLLVAFLGVLLLASVVAALLLWQIDRSLRDPDFYRDRLRNAKIYDFILNNLPRSALEEVRQIPPDPSLDLPGNPLELTGLSTGEIVSSLNRALPPEWLRDKVEENLEQPVMYLTGQRDDFTVYLDVNDRIPAFVAELRLLVREVGANGSALDLVRNRLTDQTHISLDQSGVKLDRDMLLEAVKTVFEDDWIRDQLVNVVESIVPYLTGQSDSFEVRIDLSDRMNLVQEELTQIAGELDWRQLAYDEIVDQIVRDRLDDTALVQGLDLSQEDVAHVLRTSVTDLKLETVVNEIIEEFVPYIFDTTDHMNVRIDMRDVKHRASPVLAELAESRLDYMAEHLLVCGPEISSVTFTTADLAIPLCLPVEEAARSVVLEQVETIRLELDVRVNEILVAQIPDEIHLTENDFLDSISRLGNGQGVQLVEKVRSLGREGLVYTDEDLEADMIDLLGPESVEQLHEVREFLHEGTDYTERDLTDYIEAAGGSEAIAQLESIRSQSSQVSLLKLVTGFAALLFTILIGVAWDGSIRTRVAWAFGSLATVSALAFVLFGPVYDGLETWLIDMLESRILGGISEATLQLVFNKVIELAADSVGTITGGAAKAAAVIAALAFIASATAILWPNIIAIANRARKS